MNPAGRQPPTTKRTKRTPASTKREDTKRKRKTSPELRAAAERDVSRAEALEALYRPLRDAGEAELEKTKSGRKLLEEARAFATTLGELYEKSSRSGRKPSDDVHRLARERQDEFRKRYGEQFGEAHAPYAHLQPSVESVAQILRPEIASQTTWVAEASFLRSMLLQPKATVEDVVAVRQGLGDPAPPAVHSCAIVPYGRREDYLLIPPTTADWQAGVSADETTGRCTIKGACMSTAFFHVEACIASGFVGQDFAVPPGPTKYTTTISYDWNCSGYGFAFIGVAIVNVDLAIVIDKRDGTRETHAREISLLTVPFVAGDGFSHEANGIKVAIPFTRDGSNGTVRIMVGADGHCTTTALAAYASFWGDVRVREICLTSTG